MSFHLRVSAQRDPEAATDLNPPEVGAAPRRVATFEIRGTLSPQGRSELRARVEALSPADAQTIVMHLIDVPALDEADAGALCSWVGALRAQGKPLHVAALQREIYEQLSALAGSAQWLMPFAGCETGLARRTLTFEGPSAT